MGKILSVFKKTRDVVADLEELDKKILLLDNKKKANIQLEKRIVGTLTLYSIIFYIISAIILYLYYFPEQWWQRFLYIMPILLFPIILIVVRKFLHWVFVKRIFWQDEKLNDLRTKKKETLEDVMNTQTYKKAKEILDRFDPMRFHRIDVDSPTAIKSVTAQRLAAPLENGIRRRNVNTSQNTDSAYSPNIVISQPSLVTPTKTSLPPNQSLPYSIRPVGPLIISSAISAPCTPRLPRPILPRERSLTDRLIDALVGDGPERRMALLCQRCAAHNGMALAEEFPYLAFRCCYCGLFHPPRQEKTLAPSRITANAVTSIADNDSDSDTISVSSQVASDETTESCAIDKHIEQCDTNSVQDCNNIRVSLVKEAPDLLVEATRMND